MSFENLTLGSAIFLISEWAIRLVMLSVVPFRRSPAAANSWLVLIFFEPWLGLFLYLLIGSNRLPKWRQEKAENLKKKLKPLLARFAGHPNIIQPELAPELRQAVRLAQNLGTLPILAGNSSELLIEYQGFLDRLIADIDEAKHHVHLLFYIFADDKTTGPVIDALERAVKQGVKCRVMADALGSSGPLKTLSPKFEAIGVEVHPILPYGIFRRKTARIDLRNHRKVAIIDGKIGYTGSQNMVDAEFKPGIVYEELMVRVTGPVVLELQLVFMVDWYMETRELLEDEKILPDPELTGSQAAQVVPSGPAFARENNQRLFVALVHGARERVVITTPYFIPDEALLQAMETAVLRGVDVHLIVSEKEDQLLVSLAQKSYYKELLEAGVKIHLYEKNFLHAKHLSIDDRIALIGSSNMDIRSFALNAEISILFYDEEVTNALQREQERYFQHCQLLELEKWRNRSRWKQFWQYLARLMSPLL